MTKKLYLMRHGQTLFNLQHKIQGWCDSPLTELGQKQAQVAGRYFKDHQITFDHAYSSTSERACDTLEIVTDYHMPYTRLKGLKEWNFGAFEGKDECLNPPLPYGDFFRQFGGEADVDVQKRVSAALLDVMRKEDHQNVLAVAHGAACAQFMLAWLHTSRIPRVRGIGNCAIFIYEFEEDTFTLTEYIKHDFSQIES